MKNQMLSIFKVISVVGFLAVAGCDSSVPSSQEADAGQSPKPVPMQPASAQSETSASAKPRVDLVRSEALYDRISSSQPGSGPGSIAWWEGSGIHIHPGATPSEVVFDVSDAKEIAVLEFWIKDLPPDALSNPLAGTAAVEVFLDGISQGRKEVNRERNESLTVNLDGVSSMRVVVDDSDGAQLCDWFFMGVR